MTPSSLVRSDKFKKLYTALPDSVKRKLARKLTLFKEDVFHKSINPEKLKAVAGLWKFKVDDDYECVFELERARVIFHLVVKHSEFDRIF